MIINNIIYHRRQEIRKILFASFILLSFLHCSCLIIIKKNGLSIATYNIPNLFSYNRLFNIPRRSPLNNENYGESLPNEKFYAGAARVSLLDNRFLGSISDDIPLSGYGARQKINIQSIELELNPETTGMSPHYHFFRRNKGVKDDIYSRALVIKVGDVKLAIVSVDIIGITQDLYDIVFNKLSNQNVGFNNRSQLILSATHTHSGPGACATRPLWKICTGDIFVPTVMEKLSDGIVESVLQADISIEEVKIGFGKFHLPGLQSNRRKKFYPSNQAPLDDEIVFLQIRRIKDNSILGHLINFAVHCTALPPSNNKFSADVGGSIMNSIENYFIGSIALFINGAEGDVSPSVPKGEDKIKFIGAKITQAIVINSKNISFSEKGRMIIINKHIKLPKPKLDLSALATLSSDSKFLADYISGDISLSGWVEESSYLNAVYIDNSIEKLTISTIPGEAITEIGMIIKKFIKNCTSNYNLHTVIAGLSNGYIGYIATKEQFHKGGYESLATLYDENTGQFIVDSVKNLFETILPQ
ncbi:MAG: neutral/alkaline non-lysosomal ceramidase N-terminal domain-containing protein [Candidatus Hodarchaeota archaeon]